MGSTKDTDFKHTKRVWKGFMLQNLGKYDNLCVQKGTLLLGQVFASSRNKYLQIYEVNPVHFLPTPGLA